MTEAVVQSCSVKRPATLLKKRLWHRCFPVNVVRFLRAPIFTEHLWWLLLQWLSLIRKNRKNALINTHAPFYIEKFAFISSLNLKCMLTNSGIATIFTDLYILLVYINSKSHTAADAWDNFYCACEREKWCWYVCLTHNAWDLVGM